MKKPSIDKTQISEDGVLDPVGNLASRRWFRWAVLVSLVLGIVSGFFTGR